eukprot:5613558-Pyramimonas_sp.AAC.1
MPDLQTRDVQLCRERNMGTQLAHQSPAGRDQLHALAKNTCTPWRGSIARNIPRDQETNQQRHAANKSSPG